MAPFLILSLLPFLISPSLSSIPSCSSDQFSVLLRQTQRAGPMLYRASCIIHSINVVFIYLLVLCYYCYIIPSFNVVFIYLLVLCYYCYIIPSFNVVFIHLLVLCYYCYIIPSFNLVFIHLLVFYYCYNIPSFNLLLVLCYYC